MKAIRLLSVIVLLIAFVNSCNKDTLEIDKQKPDIDFYIQNAFPVNCDTIYFG